MAVPVLRYIQGDGRLQRRHPLVKLSILILIYASLFTLEGWMAPVGIGVILFAAHMCVKGGLGMYLEMARRFIIFLLFIVAAHLFLMRGTGALSERIVSGLLQGLRIFDLLAATGLFLAVTDPIDLSDSFLGLFRPFDRKGRHLGAASLMLMVVFSFLPLLADEADRLRIAVGARCGFGGSLTMRARSAVALLAALVVGIMRRAEELEVSLEARRYVIEGARRASGSRPGAWDITLLVLSLFTFLAGIYAQL